MPLTGQKLALLVASVGAVAFLLQGYDQALMNGIIVLDNFVETFPSLDTVHTSGAVKTSNSDRQGTVVGIYEVGCAVGAMSCFILGDRLGRRRIITLAASVALLGIILQATSFQLAQLFVSRVITGIGVGIFTASVPVWVSECATAHDRGKLVMLENSMAIGGVFLVTWIELGLYFVGDKAVAWRFPIALQALFAIAVLVFISFLPESPRWLVAEGRDVEAAQVLSRLYDIPADTDLIGQEIALIRQSITAEHGGGNPNPFALTDNKQLWRTLLAISLNILTQMTGVNVISFYSDTIFTEQLGYSQLTAKIITGGIQTWQFFCASIAVLFIDRFGRRPLLLTCSFGMLVAQIGFAALTAHSSGNRAAAGASLLFDFLATFCFPVGLFVLTFLYTAEIAPLRVRARVTAMGAASNWLFNFLIAEVTPHAFDAIGWRYYLVFVCTSAVCFVVVYFFAPETKGRSLEDIDEIYIRSKTVWDPVRVAKEIRPDEGAGAQLEKQEEEFKKRDGGGERAATAEEKAEHVENV